jgi:hypothetical protein
MSSTAYSAKAIYYFLLNIFSQISIGYGFSGRCGVEINATI